MTHDIPQEDWPAGEPRPDALTHSFIVIIRGERGTAVGAASRWHGSVEHVQSRERIYFIDYARRISFIAAHCETPVLPWRKRALLRWQHKAFYHWLNPLNGTTVAHSLSMAP